MKQFRTVTAQSRAQQRALGRRYPSQVFEDMEDYGPAFDRPCGEVHARTAFVCTLPTGHKGQHVAHISAYGEPAEAAGAWVDENTPGFATDVVPLISVKWEEIKTRGALLGKHFPYDGRYCDCPSRYDGWVCTRDTGHDGPHVAHLSGPKSPALVCAVWVGFNGWED